MHATTLLLGPWSTLQFGFQPTKECPKLSCHMQKQKLSKNVFSTKVDIAKLHTFLKARKQRNQFVIILWMTTSSKEGFLFVFKPLTPKI